MFIHTLCLYMGGMERDTTILKTELLPHMIMCV